MDRGPEYIIAKKWSTVLNKTSISTYSTQMYGTADYLYVRDYDLGPIEA